MEDLPKDDFTGTEDQTPDAREDSATAADAADTIQELTIERDRLAEERNFFYDQLLRQRAEFENFRKRTEREKNDFYQFAAFELVRELLPVLDGFERAMKTSPESAAAEIHTGIELLARQLWDILTRFGLQAIESKGKKFDPNLHQAVESVQTDEVEDQTILEEWQRGYTFKGRLLRPAMVKVAVR